MNENTKLKEQIELNISIEKYYKLLKNKNSKFLIKLYLEALINKFNDLKISNDDELKDIIFLIDDYFENFKY